jgi:hypothetical protein
MATNGTDMEGGTTQWLARWSPAVAIIVTMLGQFTYVVALVTRLDTQAKQHELDDQREREARLETDRVLFKLIERHCGTGEK